MSGERLLVRHYTMLRHHTMLRLLAHKTRGGMNYIWLTISEDQLVFPLIQHAPRVHPSSWNMEETFKRITSINNILTMAFLIRLPVDSWWCLDNYWRKVPLIWWRRFVCSVYSAGSIRKMPDFYPTKLVHWYSYCWKSQKATGNNLTEIENKLCYGRTYAILDILYISV